MGRRVREVMPQVWLRARHGDGQVPGGGRDAIRRRPGMVGLAAAFAALAILAASAPAAKADEPAIEAVRRGTGIANGIAVHVGVETGELAASLGAEAPSDAEIRRVLVPGDRGAAWVKRQGTWAKVAVAMPATLDGWPQFNYDGQATNRNHDEEVGIPTGIQWTTGPHRATANNGYRFAHGLAAYERPDHTRGERPDGDHLVARDAFNGTLLRWQGTHGGHVIGSRKLKPFLIAGDSVVRLAEAGKPLVEYDDRTGVIKRSLEASLVGVPQGRNWPDMGEAVLDGDTLLHVVEDRVAAIDWPAGTLRYPLIDADNGMV